MRGLANLAERTLHTNSPSVLIRTHPYTSVPSGAGSWSNAACI